jgi:death on curing protein
MKEAKWLNKAFILAAHKYVIAETGGSQSVRGEILLESALSLPQNAYHYEQVDIFDLAAAYAEGISSNHPFIDGNKRTAFVAADIVLEKNGYELGVEIDNEQETLFLNLADGKVSRAELAEWYKQNCQCRSHRLS